MVLAILESNVISGTEIKYSWPSEKFNILNSINYCNNDTYKWSKSSLNLDDKYSIGIDKSQSISKNSTYSKVLHFCNLRNDYYSNIHKPHHCMFKKLKICPENTDESSIHWYPYKKNTKDSDVASNSDRNYNSEGVKLEFCCPKIGETDIVLPNNDEFYTILQGSTCSKVSYPSIYVSVTYLKIKVTSKKLIKFNVATKGKNLPYFKYGNGYLIIGLCHYEKANSDESSSTLESKLYKINNNHGIYIMLTMSLLIVMSFIIIMLCMIYSGYKKRKLRSNSIQLISCDECTYEENISYSSITSVVPTPLLDISLN
ncbi:hypothetical protein A3Q56_04298 [Intoshia linei]|uniref:Apextrin C-terminal domain-containing protein n=1 Tax=Intoshia linei TaxID=1819745 RepID=A0A177B3H8_9BILA|nr:hypothetical protein A3Q56_04298 [Intoshia linei]